MTQELADLIDKEVRIIKQELAHNEQGDCPGMESQTSPLPPLA